MNKKTNAGEQIEREREIREVAKKIKKILELYPPRYPIPILRNQVHPNVRSIRWVWQR